MILINNIKGTEMELTDAIRSYAEKRVDALNKFVDVEDTSVSANMEVGKTTKHHHTGDIFKAELNVSIGGKQFRAVAEKEDLYAAIDEVKDEMARILSAHKGKQATLLRKGSVMLKNIFKGFGREE